MRNSDIQNKQKKQKTMMHTKYKMHGREEISKIKIICINKIEML